MDETPGLRRESHRIASGALLLVLARLVAMAFGLVQVILLATKFGISSSTDAFFVANALCFFFVGPIDTGLTMAFVPVFVHETEAHGEFAAWSIAAGLFRLGLVVATGLSLLLVCLAPWLAPLLAPGFDAVTNALVSQFIQVMSPVILLAFAATFLSTMEFIAGRYALFAGGMIVNAMAGPAALLFFADRFGVMALAWGVLAGAVGRCLLLLTRFSRVRRLMGPGVRFRDPAIRQLGRMFVSRLLTTMFVELNFIVDRFFASFLGAGFISALAYASRAVITLGRLVTMPIVRTTLPALSRLAAQQRYERIRHWLEKLLIAAAAVLAPVAAFLVFCRTEILRVVLQRGAFDQAAADATSEALLFYAIGIIPILVTPLLTAAFFAMRDSSTPLKVGMVGVLANAALDAVLILWMSHGGIALATSLVGAIRALLLWIYLRRLVGPLRSRFVLASLLVSASAATLAFWSARVLIPLADVDWTHPLWELTGYALVGGAAYLVLQGLANRPVIRIVPGVLGRVSSGQS